MLTRRLQGFGHPTTPWIMAKCAFCVNVPANIWLQKTSNPSALASPSQMEIFTNTYMSFLPIDKENNATRESICKDDMLASFHPSHSTKLLKSVLLTTSNGIPFAMRIREDLMAVRKSSKDDVTLGAIRELDAVLAEYLGTVLCRNILTHQRITFENSSGLILEKLAKAEAVHKIRALSEMKKRLSSKGRRCFALFHPW